MNGDEKNRMLNELKVKNDHDLLQWTAAKLVDLHEYLDRVSTGFDNHLTHHRQIMLGALVLSMTCVGALAFFLLTK